jgi:hypothetical protein
MKYDVGDILLLSNENLHFMIISLYDAEGITFCDLESLKDGERFMFSTKTLDRSCQIVQKGKR